MTDYFVGIGGNNGNSGTSWANRKLTLNGAEDVPVAAGDTVYVGPGTYREQLTCDIAGSSGNPITYIADHTGANTDSVGGEVRVTGSDNDTTTTRTSCVRGSSKNYRTFRGFVFDLCNDELVNVSSSTNWIIEDCVFEGYGDYCLRVDGGSTGITVRRCDFTGYAAVQFTHSSTVDNSGIVVDNCLFQATREYGVRIDQVGGIAINSCTLVGSGGYGIRIYTALAGGQTVTVYNSIICRGGGTALRSATSGQLVEDYNSLFDNSSNRNNVSTGANSISYPALFERRMLLSGYRSPHAEYSLSPYSPLAAITGTSQPSEDILGTARPATAAKISWGAFQLVPGQRETTTVYDTSTASIKFDDAGEQQFTVPVTAVSTTISVRAYRETNYAGTNPQMIIRQPGVSDRTTTDAGSATTWNELTDTFTPDAGTAYVIVVLKSSNTATSGSYAAFFDSLAVS